jgi:hypothetical protein
MNTRRSERPPLTTAFATKGNPLITPDEEYENQCDELEKKILETLHSYQKDVVICLLIGVIRDIFNKRNVQ